MDGLPWLLFGALLVVFVIASRRRGPGVDQLRASWGRPIDRERNLSWIASYHRAIESGEALDDRTWSDLGLDDVFARLDRTLTPIGQQVLYDMLRRPLFSREKLECRERLICEHLEHRERRERMQSMLSRLSASALYDIHDLFTSELPDRPRAARLFPVLSALTLAVFVGVFLYTPLLFALPVLVVTNFVLQVRYRQQISIVIHTLAQVDALLGVAGEVAGVSDPATRELRSKLHECVDRQASLRRYSKWLIFERESSSELATILYTYHPK